MSQSVDNIQEAGCSGAFKGPPLQVRYSKEKSIEKSARSDCGNARRACLPRCLLPWSLPNGLLGATRRRQDGAQDDRRFDPKS
jgi:hypothetical protein